MSATPCWPRSPRLRTPRVPSRTVAARAAGPHARLPVSSIRPALDAADFARELAAADPEVCSPAGRTPALPAVLPPRLRYVCYLAGSVKRLVTPAHLARGLLVTNWGDSISRTVAEAALFHILACLRNTSHWAVAMHQPGRRRLEELPHRRALPLRPARRPPRLRPRGPRPRRLLEPWKCPVSVFAPDLTPATRRRPPRAGARRPSRRFSRRTKSSSNSRRSSPPPPASSPRRCCGAFRPGGVFVNVGTRRGGRRSRAAARRPRGPDPHRLDVYATEPLPADSGFRALPRSASRRTPPDRRSTVIRTRARSPCAICRPTWRAGRSRR
jgi:hypothetical protein